MAPGSWLSPLQKRRVYLDYASATPLCEDAERAMHDAKRYFGNPGSLHEEGVAAKRVLEWARADIAAEFGCVAREVAFTSGLTESVNLCILGFARALVLERPTREASRPLAGTHWVTSSIEHDSVLECFSEVERLGGDVAHVGPDQHGHIRADAVRSALKRETVFVSIGWANNEIGIVQPLADIARAVRAHERAHGTRVAFHTDAGQAPLYIAPQVHTLGVDLMSTGASKLYGPRDAGALYARDRTALLPLMLGGGQENGLRAGTESPASAAGFAAALRRAVHERPAEVRRLQTLRDSLARDLRERIPDLCINGDLKRALPHMLNVSVPGEREGEYLTLALDRAGFAVSTRSACRSGERFSHVVACLAEAKAKAAGEPAAAWRARNTVRLSFGRDTTARDLRRLADALAQLAAPA